MSCAGAKGKADKRANKAKANVDQVVKKVQEAADAAGKKLGLKKPDSKD